MAETGESLCASGLNIVSFRPDSATKEERFSKEKKKRFVLTISHQSEWLLLGLQMATKVGVDYTVGKSAK